MLVNISAIFAAALSAQAIARPPSALFGIWKPTFAQIGARQLDARALAALTLVVGPDGYVLGQAAGSLEPDGTRSNRLVSRQKTGEMAGKDLPVLYRLRGKSLIMVTDLAGSPPTSLKPTGKDGNTVFRFTR